MKYGVTLFCTIFFASTCIATELRELIGVMPGEVSKIEGRSTGGPFEILRIPTPASTLAAIFPDIEVMISRESKRVVGVSANRAFSSKEECTSLQNQVRAALSKAFSSKYSGQDIRWQYKTADSGITAGALCSGTIPYPVLRLDITHTQTSDEILRHFK